MSRPDSSPASFGVVALSLPFKFHSGGTEGLTYSIPDELADRAKVGSRVLVPLGKREKTGVLVRIVREAPSIKTKVRPISDVLDPTPVFNEDFLKWTKWLAMYYLTSWGEVLNAALPEGLKPETKARVFLTQFAKDAKDVIDLKPQRATLLNEISQHTDGISIDRLTKVTNSRNLYATLHALEETGFIRIERQLTKQASIKTETVVQLAPNFSVGSQELSSVLNDLEKHAPRQANILLAIVQQMQMEPDRPMSAPLLIKKAGASASTFKALREKEFIVTTQREKSSPELHAVPTMHEDDISNIALTLEQQIAVSAISKSLQSGKSKTFLLHGITGSGKTEVYISLAKQVLAEGNGVLILVPEISLTPQLIDRFKRRLSLANDSDVAVLHSRMSIGERSAAWRSLIAGKTRLAIGARSAVFAPVQNLKLIIVDEEHEATYKQFDKSPRYHARDAAVARAAMLHAVACARQRHAERGILSQYQRRQIRIITPDPACKKCGAAIHKNCRPANRRKPARLCKSKNRADAGTPRGNETSVGEKRGNCSFSKPAWLCNVSRMPKLRQSGTMPELLGHVNLSQREKSIAMSLLRICHATPHDVLHLWQRCASTWWNRHTAC